MFLSVILTSELLVILTARDGAVIPSHVRVRAGVQEFLRDLRVAFLASDEQR